jgi:hypothetical protein
MWSCERSTALRPYGFNFDFIKIFKKDIFFADFRSFLY